MYDALQHPVFASLRQPIHTVNAAANAVPYMHYYRGGDGGGVDAGEEDALPIL